MSGCKAEMGDISIEFLNFFTREELTFIESLIDTILPKTDSPSASEVGVHRMIDSMVGNVYTEEQQKSYRSGFSNLEEFVKKEKDLVTALNKLEKKDSVTEEVRNAYMHLKQQTVAYYLSTEEIGMNYLNYLPVPGQYVPCTTVEEVGGKAWTL